MERLAAADAKRTDQGPSPSAQLQVDTLRAFLAIIDAGSVVAAAGRVGRSPAAVSMQLKKLEETVCATLFHRDARGMTPTAAADALVGHARRLMAVHDDALDAFRRPDVSGAVRVGLVDDIGSHRLADILARFSAAHPAVVATATVAQSLRLAEALDSGALDLAVLTLGGSAPWRPKDLLLAEDPLVWIGAVGGDAYRRRPLPVAMALDGCAWRVTAVEALAAAGIDWRLAFVSDSNFAQVSAAASDLAVAIAPWSVACCEPKVVAMGSEAGLPPLGVTRLGLRFGAAAPTSASAAAITALGDRFKASYGGAETA